jgi:D-amino-acid oxidase
MRMDRRHLLRGSTLLGGLGLTGLAGCATAPALPPVRASMDRVTKITVCLRPFRASGPRLDTEQIGDALVVHNYGHGGSGWSLSWGSSTIAVRKAMSLSPREVAVIGCGALGLTSAILAQGAGARVTIYARDMLPEARSSRATGMWSPDSRIALGSAAPADFVSLWEQMARTSFATYRHYAELPGNLVEWRDQYALGDVGSSSSVAPGLDFATYSYRIPDLTPPYVTLTSDSPFPTNFARRGRSLIFNIAEYGQRLMGDFLGAGGTFERREFHAPSEFAGLPQKVVINCPGYGARALWRDQSVVPVRGQIAWLPPQPEVAYGLYFQNVAMVSRRDGIGVQAVGGGDMRGYDDANETPDQNEASGAVATLASLYSRVGGSFRV